MTAPQDCGFITRKLKLISPDPMRCAVCLGYDYTNQGKLWDKGAGQYEYICLKCELEILKDAEVDEE